MLSVNVDNVYQTEDPLSLAKTSDNSETAGDDHADNVVTVKGDLGQVYEHSRLIVFF